MAGIPVRRTELTPARLRAAAARTSDARAARRMLSIALVLDGVDRKTAAETCGMDRQTLRDWIHRYNAEGRTGLTNRQTRGGRCGAPLSRRYTTRRDTTTPLVGTPMAARRRARPIPSGPAASSRSTKAMSGSVLLLLAQAASVH